MQAAEQAKAQLPTERSDAVAATLGAGHTGAFTSAMRIELRDAVEAALRIDLVDSVKAALRIDLVDSVKAALRIDLVDSVKAALRIDLVDSVEAALRIECVDVVKAVLRAEVTDAVEAELRAELTGKVEAQLRAELKEMVRAQLRIEFTATDKVTTIDEHDDDVDDDQYEYEDDAGDPDFDPQFAVDEGEYDDEDDVRPRKQGAAHEREVFDIEDHRHERKYIVYESSLFSMMNICRHCTLSCRVFWLYEKGSLAVFESRCEACKHRDTFYLQPSHNSLSHGNFAMAANMLYSGSSPIKLLNFFKQLNVAVMSSRTFDSLQRYYVCPSIRILWDKKQQEMLSLLGEGGKKLSLGGDARCCSPGHSAKFSSYSIMDLETEKILDVQLVQVTEVANSNAMELEGLKRSLAFLEPRIGIASITTDRHGQVNKYLREKIEREKKEQPLHASLRHYFDIWHVAKSVKKSIEKVVHRVECSDLYLWKPAIVRHLYWCASSSGGNGELVEEKWVSILNHVRDIHMHDGPLYPVCSHPPLTESRQWLQETEVPYLELEKIVKKDKKLLNAVKRLSPEGQTASLESYHSLVIFFAPKAIHYHYSAMEARTLLAAIHFNENSSKPQATTKDGVPRYGIHYPKGQAGSAVPRVVKGPPTHAYAKELLEEAYRLRDLHPSYPKAQVAETPYHDKIPPSVAAMHRRRVKVNKEDLSETHHNRFAKTGKPVGLW